MLHAWHQHSHRTGSASPREAADAPRARALLPATVPETPGGRHEGPVLSPAQDGSDPAVSSLPCVLHHRSVCLRPCSCSHRCSKELPSWRPRGAAMLHGLGGPGVQRCPRGNRTLDLRLMSRTPEGHSWPRSGTHGKPQQAAWGALGGRAWWTQASPPPGGQRPHGSGGTHAGRERPEGQTTGDQRNGRGQQPRK